VQTFTATQFKSQYANTVQAIPSTVAGY